MSTEPRSLKDVTKEMTAPGQMFEIERTRVDGVEMSAWKHAPVNLRAVLELSRAHGPLDCLVYEHERYTFDDLYRVSAAIAQRLVDRGVAKGDRIAIAARNLPQWAMSFWGSVVMGAVVVPVNAWWTTEELTYGLVDSGSSIVFVDVERLERIRPQFDEMPDLSMVIVMGEAPPGSSASFAQHARVSVVSFNEFVGEIASSAALPNVDIDTDDDATMFYTSGTTGHPKGAVGTHRNLVTNLMGVFFHGQRSTLRFGGGNVDENGNSIRNAILLSVPLFHATGCLAVLITNVAAGGKLVMMHHFDAAKALGIIESERITSFGGVPTIAMQILDHPDFDKFDTSSVTSVAYGGAPAPPDLVRRIRVAFPKGQPSNGYGLTETSAGVCSNSGPDYVAKPTSCGPPVPVCEVAIVPEDFEGDDPTSELATGPDVLGELWIKGPMVIRGYWNKPDATAKAFTHGWLHTGDIARIDEDGFVYIVDRAKDMIIRGGENVYSVIVEAVISDHPDVADCAVVGLAHHTLGEEVAAVIVLRPGRVVEAEEILRHVAQHLARYEVPTKIFFRSSHLPRNPQGKVLKRELRNSLEQRVPESN
jgi:long-chain acyl-CoA synthetase